MTPYDYALIAQESYFAAPDIGVASGASRAIVRDTPDGLVVAFPGSDNGPCWLHDFNAFMVKTPFGYVHDGFWTAWNDIAAAVLARTGNKPVTFVGHSLGAAMALIAAADYTALKAPVAGVYAFEPPRVCPTAQSLSAVDADILHLYRNGNDLVTLLPLGWYQGPIEKIGTPAEPFPNVDDHMIGPVLDSLKAKYGQNPSA